MHKVELEEMIGVLIAEHDEHMKLAYSNFISGEEMDVMWAYGAGLQHAIRRLQSFVDDYYKAY